MSNLSAQDIEQATQEITDHTMSPFCPGRTISACPSSDARELRMQISHWIESGYSKEAVKNQLIAVYGDKVRGEPPTAGFGLVAWSMPAIFVLCCMLFVVIVLRKMRLRAGAGLNNPSPTALAKVQAELSKRS